MQAAAAATCMANWVLAVKVDWILSLAVIAGLLGIRPRGAQTAAPLMGCKSNAPRMPHVEGAWVVVWGGLYRQPFVPGRGSGVGQLGGGHCQLIACGSGCQSGTTSPQLHARVHYRACRSVGCLPTVLDRVLGIGHSEGVIRGVLLGWQARDKMHNSC